MSRSPGPPDDAHAPSTTSHPVNADYAPSLVAAGSLIVVVSVILAFLSGMEMTRRVVTNLVIIAAAVGITFAIGLVTKLIWGVSVQAPQRPRG
jgi:hypothetical protein